MHVYVYIVLTIYQKPLKKLYDIYLCILICRYIPIYLEISVYRYRYMPIYLYTITTLWGWVSFFYPHFYTWGIQGTNDLAKGHALVIRIWTWTVWFHSYFYTCCLFIHVVPGKEWTEVGKNYMVLAIVTNFMLSFAK